jgi:cell division protein FtsQ
MMRWPLRKPAASREREGAGVETRRPLLQARGDAGSARRASRRNRRLGRAVAPVVLLLGLAATAAAFRYAPDAYAAALRHPYFAVNQIVLSGAQALDRDSVLAAADLYVGMSIWTVDPATAEERIEELAWVREAQVRREFPNRVRIAILEREPVAIAVVEGLQYVDRTGRVLGPVRPGAHVDLPFVTGLKGQHLQGSGVPVLRRALRFIRLCEKRHCAGGVSEVHLHPVHGLVLIPREAPVPVIVGWGRWNGKIDRLERVLAAWEGNEARISSIDVTLRRSVIVKVREGGATTPVKGKAGGTPI